MRRPAFSPNQIKILKRLDVQVIYLFGSRAQGREGPLSDYDYAVLLKTTGHQRGDGLYEKLYQLFSEISPRTLKNDVIDIVFLRDIGLELRFHVVRYGKVLYEEETKVRLDFESETSLLYSDYQPLLNQFDRAIVDSL